MKELLRSIYLYNKTYYKVWVHIWVFSDSKNVFDFTYSELSSVLGIPETTIRRAIDKIFRAWNDDGRTLVEFEKSENGSNQIKLYPKGKPKSKFYEIHDEMFDWVKVWYKKNDYDYLEIGRHKKYIRLISDKIKKSMIERTNQEPNDEGVLNSFQLFFENIPDWWINQGQATLNKVNKNYDTILNQIKSKNGKKRDSYQKSSEQVGEVDFTKLTEND